MKDIQVIVEDTSSGVEVPRGLVIDSTSKIIYCADLTYDKIFKYDQLRGGYLDPKEVGLVGMHVPPDTFGRPKGKIATKGSFYGFFP